MLGVVVKSRKWYGIVTFFQTHRNKLYATSLLLLIFVF